MNIPAQLLFAAAATFVLPACTATGPTAGARTQLPAKPVLGEALPDAFYDWHGLVVMPFGALLTDSPMPLHEVLLFHDESRPAGDVESKDCHAGERPPPRFLGQAPDPYLLCFEHDRLTRVDALVRLPAATGAATFAHACVLWLKSTVPMGAGDVCEGRDGNIAFSAHLVPLADEQAVTVAMILTDSTQHEPLP